MPLSTSDTMHPDSRSTEERLRAAPPVDPDAWGRRLESLAARADAEGLIDVAYERHDSPLGPLLLAATVDGVVRIGLPAEDEDRVLEELSRRISGRILRARRTILTVARGQLEAYFDGRLTRFAVPLDWRLAAGFRRRVLSATAEIPYGRTASYGEVASAAGSPRAVRAAGTALATNPLPIIVPCHRVVRSGGALGAYRGGAEAKARLIALERNVSTVR